MSTTIDRQYLAFTLAEGRYAIPVASVREVLASASITRLPRSETHMMGVINLRGAVVPVIDLRIWLGLPRPTDGTDSSLIVMSRSSDGSSLLGALADSVQAVVDIDPDSIQKAETLTTGRGGEVLHGMARLDGEFIVILDPGHIRTSLEA